MRMHPDFGHEVLVNCVVIIKREDQADEVVYNSHNILILLPLSLHLRLSR